METYEDEENVSHNVDSLQKLRKEVQLIDESFADQATSEAENCEPVSAYGDSVSIQERLDEAPKNCISVHSILLYNDKIKNVAYLAGKIQNVTIAVASAPKGQYKVHVALLPIQKYVLKSKWYDTEKTVAIIEEYFKFTFKTTPDPKKTVLRMRVYSRHNRHSYKSEVCVGECFITLKELIAEKKVSTFIRAINPKISPLTYD